MFSLPYFPHVPPLSSITTSLAPTTPRVRACSRQHSVTSLSNTLANIQQPQRLQHQFVFDFTSIQHLAAAETIVHDLIEPRNVSTAPSTTPDDSPTLRQRLHGCIRLDELLLHRHCLHDVHSRLDDFIHHWLTSTSHCQARDSKAEASGEVGVNSFPLHSQTTTISKW